MICEDICVSVVQYSFSLWVQSLLFNHEHWFRVREITTEPFAVAVRSEGDSRGGQTYKLPLYADDLILCLSQDDISIPKARDIITSFKRKEKKKKSDYKIKLSKGLEFPVVSSAVLHGAWPVWYLK